MTHMHAEGNIPPSGKRFRTCILHIGTEKTGTTSIQGFLTANRRALLRQRVLYPRSAGPTGGSQWEFVACAHDKPWISDLGRRLGIATEADRQSFIANFKKALEREFVRSPQAERLLISSEHMHSRLVSLDFIQALKSLLDPYVGAFQIILYVRRQDRVSVSSYLHQVRMGQAKPVLFPAGVGGPLPYYFDYEAVYRRWSTIFGKNSVKLRIFSSKEWVDGDLLCDFCAACGVDAKLMQRTPALNEAVSFEGTQFLGELNRQWRLSDSSEDNTSRNALAELISQLLRGNPQPAGRDEAIAFYRQFEESNERLRHEALPDRTSPLFDEDFSSYPEQPSAPRDPSHADAVAISIAVWKHLYKPAPGGGFRRFVRRCVHAIQRRL